MTEVLVSSIEVRNPLACSARRNELVPSLFWPNGTTSSPPARHNAAIISWMLASARDGAVKLTMVTRTPARIPARPRPLSRMTPSLSGVDVGHIVREGNGHYRLGGEAV